MTFSACRCDVGPSGETASLFAERFFGECYYNHISVVAYCVGLLALACWICVTLPQMFQHLVDERADGISLSFLVIWSIGDVLYVTSTTLGGAIPTTNFLAIWCMFVGAVIMVQTLYYKFIRMRIFAFLFARKDSRWSNPEMRAQVKADARIAAEARVAEPPRRDFKRGIFLSAVVCGAVCVAALSLFFIIYHGLVGMDMTNEFMADMPLCGGAGVDKTTWYYKLGLFCAFANIPFYAGSRPPQIIRNHRRRSTEGLSMAFYILTITGNIAQVLSMTLMHPSDISRSSWLKQQAPFMCSNLSVLSFDVIILAQFFIYGQKKTNEYENLITGDSDDDLDASTKTADRTAAGDERLLPTSSSSV